MAEKSEKTEPKSAKAAEPPRPFVLEVTPKELVMPPTGNLVVKIRNPTGTKCKVYVYFDSFFWLMKINRKRFNTNLGLSNSMCSGRVELFPESSFTLTIGYLDAKYKEKMMITRCYEKCDPLDCEIHGQRTVEVPPCERKNYSHERPEGVLIIKYRFRENSGEWSEEGLQFMKSYRELDICDRGRRVVNLPTKRMDLQLKEETEEYRKYREQLVEIRKDQARRARWGQVLMNEDGLTTEKFRDFDGKIRESVWKNDWERDIPTDLKQFDALSDEEILKIRKERKQKFDETKKKEQELEEVEQKKIEEEWIKEDEEENKRKAEEAAAPKEKSKVKTVEKSKRPEDPPQKVPTPPKQKSTKSKVSVAPPKADPPPTSGNPVEKVDEKKDKRPVEKPNVTKNKKKKKANPCCTLM